MRIGYRFPLMRRQFGSRREWVRIVRKAAVEFRTHQGDRRRTPPSGNLGATRAGS